MSHDGHSHEKKSFVNFLWDRILAHRHSQYLEGLVGSIFFAIVIDGEAMCDITAYIDVFMIIGATHFTHDILITVQGYCDEIERYNRTKNWLHNSLETFIVFFQVLLRFGQYAVSAALIYYVGYVINLRNVGKLSMDPNDDMLCKMYGRNLSATVDTVLKPDVDDCKEFCSFKFINMGLFMIIFHAIYGVGVVFVWILMWSSDKSETELEMAEMQSWIDSEKKLRKTCLGTTKTAAIVVSMEPLFGKELSTKLLLTAIALNVNACQIGLDSWFLFGAVIHLLHEILDNILNLVYDLVKTDKIINRREYMIILVLKMLKLPIFIAELAIFMALIITFFNYFDSVELEDVTHPYYCQMSVWNLTVITVAIYAVVFLMRTLVVVAAFLPSDD